MKRILLLILVSDLALVSEAQPSYCLSYADFQADKWLHLDTLIVKRQSRQRQFLMGVGKIKLTSGNKKTDKILKEKAFAIIFHDTVFVNCTKLQYDDNQLGNGYTKAFRLGQDKLLLAGSAALEDQVISDIRTGATLLGGGAIGGALAAYSMREEMAISKGCFVTEIEFRSGMVKIVAIDDAFVRNNLSKTPELIEQYEQIKPKERLLATNVIPLFRKAGLIE
ncbi:MAG: hypothetical protein IJJ94_09350 [Bacteroidaceae bacterium]|nr:hypothetical protein [Bacteroidaceae bacterium]